VNPIKTILFPTDESENSRAAFCVASAIARDCNARLIILEVVPAPVTIYGPPPEAYFEQMRQALDQMEVPDSNVRVERLIAEGNPVTQIVRVAEDSQCDLILMATHARTGIRRFLTGSVAEEVMRRSRCPVLIIKSRGIADRSCELSPSVSKAGGGPLSCDENSASDSRPAD